METFSQELAQIVSVHFSSNIHIMKTALAFLCREPAAEMGILVSINPGHQAGEHTYKTHKGSYHLG